jgi:hypothetical protein|tara:strand:+ start:658 stop:1008 length:351 start_codon:yes stop_codon:yes gene_type:complete
MSTLSKDAILKADDLKTETVEVPEWGGSVILRELKGSERDHFEEGSLDKKRNVTMANMRARLVALSAIDDKGKRLFNANDVNALGNKSATALNKCFAVACRLSGITDDDVEELEKN